MFDVKAVRSCATPEESSVLVDQLSTVVQPWYGQFYLCRGRAQWASDRVSEAGYDARLEAIGGFVFVGTVMYGHPTDVRVEVHSAEPEALSTADHEVEVGLTGDGPLSIFDWGAEVPVATMDVPDGTLRLRASWFGLAAAEEHPDNDLGGDEPSPERLLFALWPADVTDRRVTRRWARP